MKFSIKDLFNKCDQIHSFLRIWSHLLKKSLMENFIFCSALLTASESSNLAVELFARYTIIIIHVSCEFLLYGALFFATHCFYIWCT